MIEPLLRTLSAGAPLSSAVELAIRQAFSRTATFIRRDVVLRESDTPEMFTAVVEGMAFRHKSLANGKRQIVGLVVPGDICDLSAMFFDRLDYGIEAATDCKIAFADRSAVRQLVATHPAVERALWRVTLANEAVLREWVVNLGRRPAHQRVAHFCCEVFTRTRPANEMESDSRLLPLTQDDIADITGLTVVHVNRVLRDLRAANIVELRHRRLTVHNWDRLRASAQFDGGYLHADAKTVSV